jgi:hypothetical protein
LGISIVGALDTGTYGEVNFGGFLKLFNKGMF